MNNLFQWIYKKITVSIIGQEAIESDATDIQIASGNQTPSAAGAITLATISVPLGFYCVVGDVDFFAGAAAVLTASYTNPATGATVNRYVAAAAGGYVEDPHDFKDRPFFAVYNDPTVSNATISITFSTTAAASTQYIVNAAYVIRGSKL